MRRAQVLLIVAVAYVATTRSATVPALAVTAACADDKSSPVMVMRADTVVDGTVIDTTTVDSFDECSRSCVENDKCAGATLMDKSCKTYSTFDANAAKATPGAKFLQKVCVATTAVCQSPFAFEAVPSKVLIGFAREVVSAETYEACLTTCLTAMMTFNFDCQSVMYYPKAKECIMNTEDRLDRPDLFQDEPSEDVVYFDNNCAGAGCFAPQQEAYVAVNDKSLELMGNEQKFDNVDQQSCESLCAQKASATGAYYNCKAYAYNADTKMCVLYEQRSQPTGRSKFIDEKGTNYYESKCFGGANACRNTPAFVRFPQMILVGFAAFVMERVPSVSHCIDQCTNPPTQTGNNFTCVSVMYYYNEQECILNTETRTTKPDLFMAETEDFKVDYFDISCNGKEEMCPKGTLPTAVKIAHAKFNTEINGVKMIVGEQMGTVDDCLQACVKLAPAKCRSFNYANNKCQLLYIGPPNTDQPSSTMDTDYYELHCVDRPAACTGAPQVEYNMAQAGSASTSVAGVVGPDACMAMCMKDTSCKAANYKFTTGKCDLYNAAGTVAQSKDTDYYMNNCAGGGASAVMPAGVQTICDLSGMKIKITGDNAFSGAVYAKMKFDTCKVEVNNEQMVTLDLGFPKKSEFATARTKRQAYGQQAPAAPPAPSSYQQSAPPAPPPAAYGQQAQPPVAPPAAYGQPAQSAPPAPSSYGQQQAAPPAAPPSSYGQAQAPSPYSQQSPPTPPTPAYGQAVTRPAQTYRLVTKPPLYGDQQQNVAPPPYAQPTQPSTPQGYGSAPSPQAPVSSGYGASQPAAPVTSGGYGGSPPAAPPSSGGYGSSPSVQPQPPSSGAYGTAPSPSLGGYPQGASAPNQPGIYGLSAPSVRPLPPSSGYGGSSAPAIQPQPPSYGSSTGGAPSVRPQPPGGAQGYGGAPVVNIPQQRDCGVVETSDGLLKATVVLQRNKMGIPGLITSMDKVYEVSCDYRSVTGEKKNAQAPLNVNGPEATLIQPRGKIELTSPVMMDMTMSGSAGNDTGPTLTAKLGDMLELRWSLMALDDHLDFFVKECVAERGGSGGSPSGLSSTGQISSGYQIGAGPGPDATSVGPLDRLVLIEKGCPPAAVAAKLMPEPITRVDSKSKTTKMQAFRFDGSRSVRITCQLEICEKECHPVTCTMADQHMESMGRRRKRDVGHVNDTHDTHIIQRPHRISYTERIETGRYFLPRLSQAMTSLTIVDNTIHNDVMHTYHAHRARDQQHSTVFDSQRHAPPVVIRGQLCLHRSTFATVFVILGGLLLVQAVVVVVYLTRRFS